MDGIQVMKLERVSRVLLDVELNLQSNNYQHSFHVELKNLYQHSFNIRSIIQIIHLPTFSD